MIAIYPVCDAKAELRSGGAPGEQREKSRFKSPGERGEADSRAESLNKWVPVQGLKISVHATGYHRGFMAFNRHLQKIERMLPGAQKAVSSGEIVCGQFARGL